jgi:hypothetical protein
MFILNHLGTVLRLLFDALLLPFRALPPFWGLLFLSLLAGIGMIHVFGRISDQNEIARLRKRMTGEVLGILLHVSRPSTVLRFAGRLIVSNFVYLWHIFRPMLVIALPFVLIWSQLEARYSTVDLSGDRDPVTVTLSYTNLPRIEQRAIDGSGILFVGPVMQVDTLREISFSILALPEHPRTLSAGGVSFPVGRTGDWSGAIIARGFDTGRELERFFRPWITGAGVVPDGPFAGRFDLASVSYPVLGGHWSWLAVFLVFSTLSALAGAKLFRVRI